MFFCLWVIKLLTNCSEQITNTFHILVRWFCLRQQMLHTQMHDLLGQHLLHVKFTDKTDVAKHSTLLARLLFGDLLVTFVCGIDRRGSFFELFLAFVEEQSFESDLFHHCLAVGVYDSILDCLQVFIHFDAKRTVHRSKVFLTKSFSKDIYNHFCEQINFVSKVLHNSDKFFCQSDKFGFGQLIQYRSHLLTDFLELIWSIGTFLFGFPCIRGYGQFELVVGNLV
mmetsp:Transcript_13055/g.18685  ORF Transcript_13055/g.18685 Transcript_13055/m.18685 type:complete len:225 (-) Transcript_13055:391-1065(-)